MTFYDVYIGDWEDPRVSREAGYIPRNLSGLFPPLEGQSDTHSVYSKVNALAHSGDLPAEQTFWQCWVVTVTRNQLLHYLDEWYGDAPIYPPRWTKTDKDPDNYEIRSFVHNLDPEKKYALVAWGD